MSADSVVPGSANGGLDGVALKSLTVDFREPRFTTTVRDENRQTFWFQLSEDEKPDATAPWGPSNPQALNRYAYVQNNPVRWTDPTGHDTYSIGITFRGGAILGGSVSFGTITDDKGNFGLYFTRTGGVTYGGALGVSVAYGETVANTVQEAAGLGKAVGVDLGYVGADYLATPSGEYFGYDVSVGIGIAGDIHAEKTFTNVSRPVNKGPAPNPCPHGPGRCGNTPLPPAKTPGPTSTTTSRMGAVNGVGGRYRRPY